MVNNIAEKYSSIFKKVQAGITPVVLINACTHGHEKVGYKVVETLKTIKLKKGTLITNIANERALSENVPFIESDLNRVFPGKSDGTYEEQIAYAINPVIKAVDLCIDIHSSGTMSVGDESALIVTKLDKLTLEVLKCVQPPRVFLMNITKNNSLISAARIGIGFEYGKDDEKLNHDYIVRDILKILSMFGLIDDVIDDYEWKQQTKYYDVFDVLPKEGLEIKAGIQNFVTVKKGDLLGKFNGEEYFAPVEFIPILFGKNRYKNIYGFMSKAILSE